MRFTARLIVLVAIFLYGLATPVLAQDEAAIAHDSGKNTPSTLEESGADAILYYFHRTSRCRSCLNIEAYIAETLHADFQDALDDGRLVWRPVNIDEPEYAHFEQDFSLMYASAVLVHLEGDEMESWAILEDVWELLEDKKAFGEYIRTHVGPVLGAESPAPGAAETPSAPRDG